LPEIIGGFGDWDGVGDISGMTTSIGSSGATACVLCQRSREIHRRIIAVSAARNKKNVKRRNVLRRILATRPIIS
jgi:hypothetical protein